MLQSLIQVQAVRLECFDISGEEEAVVRIKQIEIPVKYHDRQFIIEPGVFIVPVGQELGRQVTAQALVQAGLEHDLFGRLGGRRASCRERRTDKQYRYKPDYSQTCVLQNNFSNDAFGSFTDHKYGIQLPDYHI